MFYEMTGFAPADRGPVNGEPPRPDMADAALFLDFDGVLVEIAETPDGIFVPEGLVDRLAALHTLTGGALAIVSGRAIEAIDGFLPGYPGDVIGSHGAERRVGGQLDRHPLAGSEEVDKLQGVVRSFAQLDSAFLVEDKPCGVVLHYRRNPDLCSEAFRFMESLSEHFPRFKIQPAKMAVEIKPSDIGKVAAVRWLMDRAPYEGRRPVYFGDDDTDEPAMEWVIGAGGFAVKVGEGDTRADHRLESVDEVGRLLAHWAQRSG